MPEAEAALARARARHDKTMRALADERAKIARHMENEEESWQAERAGRQESRELWQDKALTTEAADVFQPRVYNT